MIRTIKNRKLSAGVGFIEVIVALLISVGIFFGATKAFKAISNSLNASRISVQEAQEVYVGSQLLIRDFQNLAVSFNLSKQVDDCGDSFFDYSEDVWCPPPSTDFFATGATTRCGVGRCERVKNLLPSVTPSATSSFIVLADKSHGKRDSIDFTPAALFAVPGAANVNLTMNRNEPKQMIDRASQTLLQNPIWEEGGQLLISTTTPFKDPAQPNSRLKSVSYIGTMRNDGTLSEPPASLLSFIDLSHTMVAGVPTSFTGYLMNLPLEAGRQPLLSVRPVEVVRYFLRSIVADGKPAGELVRSVWNPSQSAFVSEAVLGTKLKGVRFARESISTDKVSFKLSPMNESINLNMLGAQR